MLESSKVFSDSFPNEKINDVNGDLVAQKTNKIRPNKIQQGDFGT